MIKLADRRPARLAGPRQLFADRGCDHDKYRRQLRHLGITPRGPARPAM
jgi:hypothetical protein